MDATGVCRLPGSSALERSVSKAATSGAAPNGPSGALKAPLSHCGIHWVCCPSCSRTFYCMTWALAAVLSLSDVLPRVRQAIAVQSVDV